jgi:hypothetical protein
MSTNRIPFQADHDQKPLQSGSATNEPAAAEQFPSARYFQVHFQYLHENNQLLQKQLVHLEQQIEQLNRRLERICNEADCAPLRRLTGTTGFDAMARNRKSNR